MFSNLFLLNKPVVSQHWEGEHMLTVPQDLSHALVLPWALRSLAPSSRGYPSKSPAELELHLVVHLHHCCPVGRESRVQAHIASHQYKSMPGKYYHVLLAGNLSEWRYSSELEVVFLLMFLPFLQMYFLVLSSPEWPQASPEPSPSLLWPNAAPAVLLNRQRLKYLHLFWVFIHILTSF